MRLKEKYILPEDSNGGDGGVATVGLAGIAPILFVLTVGLFIATLVFLVEMLFPPFAKKLSNRKKGLLNSKNARRDEFPRRNRIVDGFFRN